MKNIDIRFDKKTMELLQSLIGKRMIKLLSQRVEYLTSVDEVVILQIENSLYKFTNSFKIMDYMNDVDEVAIFRFTESNAAEMTAYEDEYIPPFPMASTTIEQTIREIRIVNENQQMFQNGVKICNADTVRGIVFILEDGREVALEKDIWFSELIFVTIGHNLIEGFSTLDETFLHGWDSFPEIKTEGSREVVVLKQETA